MGQPAAKEGDRVIGVDIHVVMVPSPAGEVPTPIPTPFSGPLNGNLSHSAYVDGHLMALVDSTVDNSPAHIPTGGRFQNSPSNLGTVKKGSPTVVIDGRHAARNNDPVRTCNDPQDTDAAHIIATGSVIID